LISQRDIVEVAFELPQGRLRHPVIVLSNDDAINLEQFFIGIMMTTEDIDDEYSFPIEDYMLNKPLTAKSQVRLHLIGWFSVDQVIKTSYYNHIIKIDFFRELIRQVNQNTFGITF
jgi:hypothetical protein